MRAILRYFLRHMFFIFISCLLIMGSVTQSISGSPQQIKSPSQELSKEVKRKTIHNGVRLSKKITIHFVDHFYSVPFGYLQPWRAYRPKKFRIDEDSLGFNVSFWMPEGRFIEHNLATGSHVRPSELGRAKPTPLEFVVMGVIDSPKGYLKSPGKHPNENISDYMFRSYRQIWYPEDSLVFKHLEYNKISTLGLIEGSSSKRDNIKFYKNINSDDLPVFIICDISDYLAFHCEARSHIIEDELLYRFRFPKEKLNEWRTILNKFRELALSWRSSK